MSSYLINKNLVIYYRLRRLIGKRMALRIARVIECLIVMVLGRDKL